MNNDTMTLFLATSILAIGGLGLYMFNTDANSKQKKSKKPINEDYSDDEGDNDTIHDDDNDDKVDDSRDNVSLEEEEPEYVTKTRGAKTKKSRQSKKGTKKRY